MKQQRLFLDGRPNKQPEGTYPYGKNGVQFDQNESVFNEPGFEAMAAAVPYTLIGKVETDSKPVLFSADGTNSGIGFFNPDTGLYEAIVDDNPLNLVNWPNDGSLLGFTLDHYITGQSQRNYKGELIVAFTDKDKFPKYINCDTPVINKLDDTRLFPINAPASIAVTESLGGALTAGTYYVAIAFERYDGTTTQFSDVSDGITIPPGDIGTITDKAILVTISNADQDYDFIRIVIISKVEGKVKVIELTDPAPITSTTVELLYTGDNLSTEITLSEVLTPPAIYEKVQCMAQLNDALYLGGLDKEPDIRDMQQYANLVRLKWKSELISAVSPPIEHVNGTKKSFMHEEVYAFFIRYRKVRGGFTPAFIIPGLDPVAGDLVTSAEATAGGTATAVPKYKVDDTIHSFAGFDGDCGIWKNDVELYPDTIDFDSTLLGGRNLRNQPVLHHKMPSIRWCKANLYSANGEYGKTQLDLLGITPSNITIPVKYSALLDGYQILYARRTPTNQIVYGQALLLHGCVDVPGAGTPTGSVDIYTSGGNWTTSVWHMGKGDYNDDWELIQLRKNTMRFHSFDMLFNKPSVSPSFISAQLKVRRQNLRNEGYLEDGADSTGEMPTSHLVDYTRGVPPAQISSGNFLRALNPGFYLTNGLSVGTFINSRHEGCWATTMRARPSGTDWALSNGDSGIRIRGQDYTEAAVGSPDFEESYLINLIAVKADVYSKFYSQRLVSAGAARDIATLTTIWGGDTFVCDYTFHTYGRHDVVDTRGGGFQGIKVIRRFVCESASNIRLRYEIPGNEYSKWYPHTPVSANNPNECYITLFDRSKDPNQFGYRRDFNALNDFISSTIFNPFLEEITHFPYRIHRGGKLSRQAKPRNWRTFLALDFYECQKNMGLIINLEGMDDRLIIHHENALFRTQDKAKLETGVLSITLGTGDIFQFEPQSPEDTKLGYAGTQHDLACIKTPIGYVFVDAKQGEMYMMKDKIQNLNIGANTFLRDALKVVGRNVYTGNGITIGWDQKYKRILLTIKNEGDPGGSFTMSFSVAGRGWVFFHDYIPDMYIHTRELLFSAKDSEIFRHNTGAPGLYYDTPIKPFFIDVIFRGEDSELTLETINWISEYLTNQTDQTFKTLSHISIWNSHQHTGRIALRENLPLLNQEIRRTQGEWSFNDFRNILTSKGVKFLADIFNDYALDGAQADVNLPWYFKELLIDQWFCVRFEFDNATGETLLLHDVTVHATKAPR